MKVRANKISKKTTKGAKEYMQVYYQAVPMQAAEPPPQYQLTATELIARMANAQRPVRRVEPADDNFDRMWQEFIREYRTREEER